MGGSKRGVVFRVAKKHRKFSADGNKSSKTGSALMEMAMASTNSSTSIDSKTNGSSMGDEQDINIKKKSSNHSSSQIKQSEIHSSQYSNSDDLINSKSKSKSKSNSNSNSNSNNSNNFIEIMNSNRMSTNNSAPSKGSLSQNSAVLDNSNNLTTNECGFNNFIFDSDSNSDNDNKYNNNYDDNENNTDVRNDKDEDYVDKCDRSRSKNSSPRQNKKKNGSTASPTNRSNPRSNNPRTSPRDRNMKSELITSEESVGQSSASARPTSRKTVRKQTQPYQIYVNDEPFWSVVNNSFRSLGKHDLDFLYELVEQTDDGLKFFLSNLVEEVKDDNIATSTSSSFSPSSSSGLKAKVPPLLTRMLAPNRIKNAAPYVLVGDHYNTILGSIASGGGVDENTFDKLHHLFQQRFPEVRTSSLNRSRSKSSLNSSNSSSRDNIAAGASITASINTTTSNNTNSPCLSTTTRGDSNVNMNESSLHSNVNHNKDDDDKERSRRPSTSTSNNFTIPMRRTDEAWYEVYDLSIRQIFENEYNVLTQKTPDVTIAKSLKKIEKQWYDCHERIGLLSTMMKAEDSDTEPTSAEASTSRSSSPTTTTGIKKKTSMGNAQKEKEIWSPSSYKGRKKKKLKIKQKGSITKTYQDEVYNRIPLLLGRRSRYYVELWEEQDFLEKWGPTLGLEHSQPLSDWGFLIKNYRDDYDGYYLEYLLNAPVKFVKRSQSKESHEKRRLSQIREVQCGYNPPPCPSVIHHPAAWGLNTRRTITGKKVPQDLHPACASMSKCNVTPDGYYAYLSVKDKNETENGERSKSNIKKSETYTDSNTNRRSSRVRMLPSSTPQKSSNSKSNTGNNIINDEDSNKNTTSKLEGAVISLKARKLVGSTYMNASFNQKKIIQDDTDGSDKFYNEDIDDLNLLIHYTQRALAATEAQNAAQLLNLCRIVKNQTVVQQNSQTRLRLQDLIMSVGTDVLRDNVGTYTWKAKANMPWTRSLLESRKHIGGTRNGIDDSSKKRYGTRRNYTPKWGPGGTLLEDSGGRHGYGDASGLAVMSSLEDYCIDEMRRYAGKQVLGSLSVDHVPHGYFVLDLKKGDLLELRAPASGLSTRSWSPDSKNKLKNKSKSRMTTDTINKSNRSKDDNDLTNDDKGRWKLACVNNLIYDQDILRAVIVSEIGDGALDEERVFVEDGRLAPVGTHLDDFGIELRLAAMNIDDSNSSNSSNNVQSTEDKVREMESSEAFQTFVNRINKPSSLSTSTPASTSVSAAVATRYQATKMSDFPEFW